MTTPMTKEALIAQIEGAIRLLAPQDLSPLGVRVLEKILAAAREPR